MQAQPTGAAASPPHPGAGVSRDGAPRQLRGLELSMARSAWALMATLALIVAIAGLPEAYARAAAVCVGQHCLPEALTPLDVLALRALGAGPAEYAALSLALIVIAALVFVGAGLLVVRVRSSEPATLITGLMCVCVGASLVAGETGGWGPGLVGFVGWSAFLAGLFSFPDGRLLPSWSGWAVLLLVALELIYFGAPLMGYTVPAWLEWVGSVAWVGGWVGGLAAQVYRYRRVATPVQRLQTRWVVYGLTLVVGAFLLALIPPQIDPGLRLFGLRYALVAQPLLVGVALPVLPATIALATLRRRLWDVDPLINRTVVYTALSGCVLVIYVGLVSYLGVLFRAVGSPAIALAATVVVALVFQPLRDRLQRSVNRLMYGERDDPYAVLARLGRRLETTLTPDAVLPTIVETVAQALRLPYAAIALDQDNTCVAAAATGALAADLRQLPLVYQGGEVGRLILGRRDSTDDFTPAEERLLADLARQAGVAGHAILLHTQVLRSRERLVLAREEERRRLHRDLHDDLGPTLAALALSASHAADLIGSDPAAAERIVRELRSELRAGVGQVRRIAYDLRPPLLEELGLVGALRDRAMRYSQPGGLRVAFDAPEGPLQLPAAVEVAAYRIAQEALANVEKYAEARTCTISLHLRGTCLLVEVRDDGVGLPEVPRAGIGLSSMRERAAELGGFCTIGPAEPGTRVYAELPAGSGEPTL